MLITLWTRSSLELTVVVVLVAETLLVVVLAGLFAVVVLTLYCCCWVLSVNWKWEGGTILSESEYWADLVQLMIPLELTSCSARPSCSCWSAEDWRGQIWCRSYWSANRSECRENVLSITRSQNTSDIQGSEVFIDPRMEVSWPTCSSPIWNSDWGSFELSSLSCPLQFPPILNPPWQLFWTGWLHTRLPLVLESFLQWVTPLGICEGLNRPDGKIIFTQSSYFIIMN